MNIGLVATLAGLSVAGLAAVLGIWMERDQAKPPRYAYALSILILMATSVGLLQAYLDAESSAKLEEDMARMLEMLDELAQNSEDPALSEFVASEMKAQSRSNPRVVGKLRNRVAKRGGDPDAMLGRHLPAGDIKGGGKGGAKGGAKGSSGAKSAGAKGGDAKGGDAKASGKSAGGDEGKTARTSAEGGDAKGGDAKSGGGKSGGGKGGKGGK